MATCPNCGCFSYGEASFCVHCGSPLMSQVPPTVDSAGQSTERGPRAGDQVPVTKSDPEKKARKTRHGCPTLPLPETDESSERGGEAPTTPRVDAAFPSPGQLPVRPSSPAQAPSGYGDDAAELPRAATPQTGLADTSSLTPPSGEPPLAEAPGDLLHLDRARLEQALRDQELRDQALRDQAQLDDVLRDEDFFWAESPPEGAAHSGASPTAGAHKGAVQGQSDLPVTGEAPPQGATLGGSPSGVSFPRVESAKSLASQVFDSATTTPATGAALADELAAPQNQPSPAQAPSPPKTTSLPDAAELFGGIAAEQMRPIRDFVIELTLGEPSHDWIDVVLPIAQQLRESAAELDLLDLSGALDLFISTLQVASGLGDATIEPATKAEILKSHERLASLMPDVFRLDQERARREPVIVLSLLRQVPNCHKVDLDKLYAAGFTSLHSYYAADAEAIAEKAGVGLELAAAIAERFERYRSDVAHASPASGRTKEIEKLAGLLERLRLETTRFEEASHDWTPSGKALKRNLRRERNETLQHINALLARLGEVDLVMHLERLSFAERITEMEHYLVDVTDLAAGHAPASGRTKG